MAPYTFDDLYPSMAWEQIDTVVFDIGNVLLSFRPEELLADAFPDDAALRARLRLMFSSPYWIMLDRGTLDREEFCRRIAKGDAELGAAVDSMMARFASLKRPVDAGVRVLRECARRGKRLIALSNYGGRSYAEVKARFAFFGLLDGEVISAYEGLLKPGREIYELLTERYRLDPARTLFLDDTPANVEGALAAGLQSMVFVPESAPGYFGLTM